MQRACGKAYAAIPGRYWRLIRIRVKSSNLSAEQLFLLLGGIYSPISLYIHAKSSSDT
jgi:hypothetical protein